VPFDPLLHAVEDEGIAELTITQQEGEFASLQITIRNPFQGLLAGGRMQWCWLSWHDGAALVPLFCGRLTGVPKSIAGETVQLTFTARPIGYETLRDDLAAELKVLPYWDVVWITGDTEDADNVLEAYGARWHIDRRSLDVTVSDEVEGEDGTLTFGESDHVYDALTISYTGTPLSQIDIDAELSWTQGGAGTIDVTERIYNAFLEHSYFVVAQPKSGIIQSMTGEGLASDWPEGGASLDGGWTVNDGTYCEELTDWLYTRYDYHVVYEAYTTGSDPLADAVWQEQKDNLANGWFRSQDWWFVDFPIFYLQQKTKFDWKADRGRIETLKCTVVADIQPLIEEAGLDANIGKIAPKATDTVTEPDAVSGDMPIGDVGRASYLNTDRGQSSVEYLLLLARAQLRRGARVVEVECNVPWAAGVGVSLRHNARVVDYRLPGGEATGKITAYEMTASGSGNHSVTITIGCTIGHGGTVAEQAGDPSWVDDGYLDAGYQKMAGATSLAPTGDIAYQTLDDFEVDDDGVNLLSLDASTAVESLVVKNGIKEQAAVIDAADPVEAMKHLASEVCVQLVPLTDAEFETAYTPTVEPMPIPRTIDLEAA